MMMVGEVKPNPPPSPVQKKTENKRRKLQIFSDGRFSPGEKIDGDVIAPRQKH